MSGGLTVPWIWAFVKLVTEKFTKGSLTVTLGGAEPNPEPAMVTAVCCPEGHALGVTAAEMMT